MYMGAGAKDAKKEDMLKHPKFIKNKELSTSLGLKRKGEGEQVKHGAEVVHNYNYIEYCSKGIVNLGRQTQKRTIHD